MGKKEIKAEIKKLEQAANVNTGVNQPNQPIAQSDFPDFLQGTWKVDGKDINEHWDKLNDSNLKGFSYELNNGLVSVFEYLDLSRHEDMILYTATVLNQNQGRSICFKLTETDPAFVFENPDHDFPKKIEYRKLTDTEILVRISDGKQKEFSWKMTRQAWP